MAGGRLSVISGQWSLSAVVGRADDWKLRFRVGIEEIKNMLQYTAYIAKVKLFQAFEVFEFMKMQKVENIFWRMVLELPKIGM